jgi:tRNA(fMet)-specific endonuclease VapC
MNPLFTRGLDGEPLQWLLDTNIVSELCRPAPDGGVLRQYERHAASSGLPAPVWHELNFGCLRMPEGKRKSQLTEFLQMVIEPLPRLPYDGTAAMVHARLRAEMALQGRVMPLLDGQIAAVAIASGCTLVTRNVRDFASLPGLRLVNWFEDE